MMNTLKKISLFALMLAGTHLLKAQELNCRVVVNGETAGLTDKSVFRDMEESFSRFLNEQSWTELSYQPQERIKCNLVVNIESVSGVSNFKATATVQAARPVYNSTYETLFFFMFGDKDFSFEYTESQPLVYAENSYSNNITSLLSFYAYLIIGMDLDTFSLLGGNEYLDIARDIVSNSQNQGYPGWEYTKSPNSRAWLTEDLQNGQMLPYREGMYTYHRQGMDLLVDKPDEARVNILSFLKNLEKLNELRPNSLLIRQFFYAKASEIANIFSKGDIQVRKQAYEILTKVNPTETETYAKILK
ncbi:MAG: DUF4835 family protein [Cytophagales bacterium]|nr:DUF4835 family protein [Cytophagales bacterium]